MKRVYPVWLVLVGLAIGGSAWAAGTNAPAASTNAPVVVKDYRAMLQRVRLKQQEHTGLEELRQAIATFQTRFGRLPAELPDLVTRGVLAEPLPPPSGCFFAYDKMTGNVKVAPIPSKTSVRTNLSGSANLILPR
jgi:hypothetical protein